MKNALRRQSYVKQILLSELINGQNLDYIYSYKDENYTINYNVKFDNLYLVVMGIPQSIYSNIYKMNASEYMNIFLKAREYIKSEFEDNKFSIEIALNLFDNSKKILLFITPNKGAKHEDLKNLVLKSHNYLYDLYKEYIKDLNENYINLTAISRHITNWKDIQNAYTVVNKYSYLSFFTDDLQIIDNEQYNEMLKPFSYMDVKKITNEIINSLLENDITLLEKLCDELFLEKLKASFDMRLCYQILFKLKINILDKLNLNNEEIDKIDYLLNSVQYYKIEEMNTSIKNLLVEISNKTKDTNVDYHIIIKKALEYIHANYHKKLLLNDISNYANVVPQHLSKVFNKEMQQSIPSYINKLRIDKAKMLLIKTDMQSSMISVKTGFESPRRFGQLFKEIEGITPLHYRKQFTNNT